MYAVARYPNLQKALRCPVPTAGLRQDHDPSRLGRDHVPSTNSGVLKKLCILPDASLSRKACVLSNASSLRQSPHIVSDVENWGNTTHATNVVFIAETPSTSRLWHGRLGHLGATMLRRMISLLEGHTLCTRDVEKTGRCGAYSEGKFSIQASKWKLPTELLQPLERLQGDVYSPITSLYGPFNYFFVLIDASSHHADVSLFSTRNLVFPKLLAMLLKICTHYPNSSVKALQVDNVVEFRSKTFEDYCIATNIALTYSIPYEHSQNGLAEEYIKKLQMVAQLLLLHTHLLATFWGHALLHTATLLQLCPTLLNVNSSHELLIRRIPNVSHLRIFGCKVWALRPKPQRKTIAAHRKEEIYVGFDFPSILRYIIHTTGALLCTHFQNYVFKETIFPRINSPKNTSNLCFRALKTLMLNSDPRTALTETEVQKILHLQALAQRLLDGFLDGPRITRLPPPGSGLTPLPRKRKVKVASMHADTTPHPKSRVDPESIPLDLNKARTNLEWHHWQEALQAQYASLRKHKVFGELIHSLKVSSIGYKLIFIKKRDA